MATFQIHQDDLADKENPPTLKEKSLMGGKANVLQPLAFGGGLAGGGIPSYREKQVGGRSNFVLLNANMPPNARNGFGSKMGFRDANAQKAVNEEKRSTVVPVVEQFRNFSVYGEQSASQHAAEEKASTAPPASGDEEGKENGGGAHQTQQLSSQSTSIHKEFAGIGDDDYLLDTTPMSVSDVLSPMLMSVDRSTQCFDVSVSEDIADKVIDSGTAKQDSHDNVPPGQHELLHLPQQDEQQQEREQPCNDRKRFFEVLEYQDDIVKYFRESEHKHRPKPHYMRRQADINYSMRTILVDWLVEVSEEYNLDTETLYLAVSYIDRFLSQMSVVRSKLQLVGTAAMYIASKYEEIYPPEVTEFVFITDDTYNKTQVLRMEQIILKILAFDLCTPTAYAFINTYAVLFKDMPDRIKCLALYISELSLLDADPYLRFLPSIISAGAVALARYSLDMPVWCSELEDITTYRLEDLKEIVLCLSKSHNAAATLAQQAIQEKYASDKFKKASTVPAAELTCALYDAITREYNDLAAARRVDQAQTLPPTVPAQAATGNEDVRRMISRMFN